MNHKYLPGVALLLTVLGCTVTPIGQKQIPQSPRVSEDAPRMRKHRKPVGNSVKATVGLNKGRTYESSTQSNLASMGDAF
jgi:uncharacterized protein (DUF2342 family)